MGIRKGLGKGVFEQDSELVGGVWVKKGSKEVLRHHFPDDIS